MIAESDAGSDSDGGRCTVDPTELVPISIVDHDHKITWKSRNFNVESSIAITKSRGSHTGSVKATTRTGIFIVTVRSYKHILNVLKCKTAILIVINLFTALTITTKILIRVMAFSDRNGEHEVTYRIRSQIGISQRDHVVGIRSRS